MYLKLARISAGGNHYSYVRLMEYVQGLGQPGKERVVCNLGKLDDVLQHRDEIIKGLQGLKKDEPKTKKRKR